MARTTAELVGGVIEVDSVAVPSLTPFIAAASALVTRVCEPEYDLTNDDDIELLTQIETWLAAHFYGIRDNRVASEGVGPVNASYQHRLGLVLAVTMHGQTAMSLDTSGALAAYSKQLEQGKNQRVGVSWLGTDCEDEDSEGSLL